MAKNELSKTDLFGITASTLCAVHCIATPLAMAFLPAVAGDAWESELVHQICAGAVAVFCLLAAAQGYRKHADWRPLVPLALGLLFVGIATFLLPESFEVFEMPILCLGSSTLVIGHIWNLRRLASCCDNCIQPSSTVEITEPIQEY